MDDKTDKMRLVSFDDIDLPLCIANDVLGRLEYLEQAISDCDSKGTKLCIAEYIINTQNRQKKMVEHLNNLQAKIENR